jgi:hypothetical protein
MIIVCHDNSPIDVPLKGIGKLHAQPGCKGYSTSTLPYGSSVVSNVSMQLTGDFLSQIDLKNVCCEELGVKVTFCQTSEIAYKKTIAHLDDLRSASTRVSDLLKKVNKQEWKNHYVIYRNTHSVLIVLIVSVILIYLLLNLHTFTGRWMPACSCRKEAPTASTEGTLAVGTDSTNHTANNSNTSNEDKLEVATTTPQSPTKASNSRVATSHF